MFSKRSALDVLDWKPTRSPEVEAQNEIDDVAQMLEAQNEGRRRAGQARAHGGGDRGGGPSTPAQSEWRGS